MAEQTSSLIVRLVDEVTGTAKRVGRALTGIGESARRAGGRITFADRLDAAMARQQRALTIARGNLVEATAAMYAFYRASQAPIEAAKKFESALVEIGNKANLTAEQLKAIGEQAKRQSEATNQFALDLLKSTDILVGFGLSLEQATATMPVIGKAATATGASIEDMSNLAYAAMSNLEVPFENLLGLFDKLAAAGKAGGFELKDMARHFPSLGAAAGAAGMKGEAAATDIAAALQIVRRGAGDSATAATNLENVFQKMKAPLTQKAFGKFGIDIRKQIARGVKAGKSPIEIFVEEAKRAMKKGALLEDLFTDKQVREAMIPLINYFEDYKTLRAEAGKARDVIDRDFANKVATAAEKTKRFQIALDNLNTSLGGVFATALGDVQGRLTPMIAWLDQWVQKHPGAVSAIYKTVGAVLALNLAVAAFRWGSIWAWGGVLTLTKAVTSFGGWAWRAAAGQIALTTALGAMSGTKVGLLAKLGAGLRGFLFAIPGVSGIAKAITAIGLAIGSLSFPALAGIGVIVGGLAVGGWALWKHWERVSNVFKGVAQRLGQEFAPALEAARPVIEWFKSIGGAIGDAWERAAAKVGEWFSFFTTQEDLTGREEVSLQFAGYRWADAFINGIKSLPERVMGVLANLKDKFVEAGRNAIKGLWDGMQSMIDSLIAWLSEQVDRIVAPFRGLGAKIRSSLPAWAGGGSATAAPEAPAPAGAANPEGKGDFGGARAEGGPVSRGKSYLVGERGPEIFTAPASGAITPNRALAPPSLTAHFNITFNGNGGNNVDEIRRVLREEVHKAFRGVYADAGMRFA